MPQDKRIARWLAQLARLYTGEQRRLTAEYRSIVSRLEPERLQLTASMERLERAGNLTPQNVRDLAAYGRLLARTADELNGYGRVLESSLARISDGSIQLGTEAAWNLSAEMAGRLGEVVRTAYRQPDTDVIRQLVRYVDSDAMRANLAKFGQAGADNLADVLLAGLGSGQGASAVARLLTNWYAVPLAWSENMTRTLGNWSYRMASHASYRLNSDIVTGWVWSASLDARCCLSCVAMHGTRHTHDEVLNDHHRGRCAAIPIVRGGLVADSIGTGEAWFDGLSDVQKREMMGPGRYDLYTSGRWDWRAVSKRYNDPVYGEMLRAATLTEMRGR